MALHGLTLLSVLVAGLASYGPAANAQAGRGAHSAPAGVSDSAPLRVPDRVWSTRPAPPAPAGHPGGVVVMTPHVVLGWGGLPPSGPVVQPAPGGPGYSGGWQSGPPPGRRPFGSAVVPVPGVPGQAQGHPAGPATLHHWRSP